MNKNTLVVSVALLSACASTPNGFQAPSPEKQAALGNSPIEVQALLNTLYNEGEWAAVLNYNRLAVAAIEQGRTDIARSALDGSISRIESVYADDATAKKARGLWSAEGIKDFKGEPYERAMTYYYRGLLYMADGDYQNARASFRTAEYQDTVAEKEEFAGDFGAMNVLAGWASHCDGDESAAAEYYDKARTQQYNLPRPPATANTLVLIESGLSPVKSNGGKYQEELLLSRSSAPGSNNVSVSGATVDLLGDVGFQATTRGGRQVDKVLAGKVSFKDTTQAIGATASAVGLGLINVASYSNDPNQMQNLAGLGLVSSFIGLASSMTASATTPKADSRYWDNLPDKLYGAFVAIEQDDPPFIVVDGMSTRPSFEAKAGNCRLILVRTGTNSRPSPVAPGNTLPPEKEKILKRNQKRDAKFHQEVTEMLATSSTAGL